jgi:hypothetical protein
LSGLWADMTRRLGATNAYMMDPGKVQTSSSEMLEDIYI